MVGAGTGAFRAGAATGGLTSTRGFSETFFKMVLKRSRTRSTSAGLNTDFGRWRAITAQPSGHVRASRCDRQRAIEARASLSAPELRPACQAQTGDHRV